jgi:hypothetical protein
VPRLAATFAFLFAIPVFLTTGCERQAAVENANIDVVNRRQEQAQKRGAKDPTVEDGLAPKEVESVLGLPTKSVEGKTVREFRREISFVTWTYEKNGQNIELSFIDGKLQGKVPKFGEKLDPEAPLHMKKKKAPVAEAGAE